MGEDWLNTKANVSLVHSTCMITSMSLNVSLRKTKVKNCPVSTALVRILHCFTQFFFVFFCALSMLVITIESADVWNDHVVVVCALESQKIKLVLNSSSVYLAPHFFSGQ